MAKLVLSEPLKTDLVVYRGDSGSFMVTMTDADGTPMDVSTATWLCQMRSLADDTTVLATLEVTPVGGDPASVVVHLPDAESDALSVKAVWDLQMTMDGEVTTPLAGDVIVTKDVSRPP